MGKQQIRPARVGLEFVDCRLHIPGRPSESPISIRKDLWLIFESVLKVKLKTSTL